MTGETQFLICRSGRVGRDDNQPVVVVQDVFEINEDVVDASATGRGDGGRRQRRGGRRGRRGGGGKAKITIDPEQVGYS